jgi:hypothetical protein
MTRLLAVSLLLLAACGEEAPPVPKSPRVAATDGGIAINLSGEATIGVSGSY